ncbi:carboxypeptidase-like regulatory domain-containing protein [Pyxidicoccus sp. 3LG]
MSDAAVPDAGESNGAVPTPSASDASVSSAGASDAGTPESARTLEVLVLGPDGAPLADSRVRLVPERLDGVNDEARTDELGKAGFAPTEAGRYRLLAVWAEAKGLFQRHTWKDVELRAPTAPARVELRFAALPSATITGTVRGLDGKPAENATVKAVQLFPSVSLDDTLVRNTAYPVERAMAKTDAEGRFTLEHLREGEYGLEVEHASGRADAVARTGGPAADIVVAHRCAKKSVTGRVVDVHGTPIPSFTAADTRVKNKQGRFKLPGQCYFHIEARGFIPQGVPVLGLMTEHATLPDIVLKRGRELSGRLLNADGTPAKGFTLTTGTTGYVLDETDDAGRFSVGRVPVDEDVLVEAKQTDTHVTLRVRVRAPEKGKATLRFPPDSSRVEVRMQDETDSTFTWKEVTAEGTWGSFTTLMKDAGPVLLNLPPGPHEIQVKEQRHKEAGPVPRRFPVTKVEVPATGTARVELKPVRGPGRLRVVLPRPTHYNDIFVVAGDHPWPADLNALGPILKHRLAPDERKDIWAQPGFPVIYYEVLNDFSELVPGAYTVFARDPYSDEAGLRLVRQVVQVDGQKRGVVQVRFHGEDSRLVK